MNPTNFPEANFTFVGPESMPDCGDLPVKLGLDEHGHSTITSCFELSDADKEEILKTGKVYLTVWGKGMPPVAVTTDLFITKTDTATLMEYWLASLSKLLKAQGIAIENVHNQFLLLLFREGKSAQDACAEIMEVFRRQAAIKNGQHQN